MYYEYQRTGGKDPVAPHARHSPRRKREHSVFPDRAGSRAAGLVSEIAGAETPGDWTPHLELAVEDCYKRLLVSPSKRKCAWN